MKKVLSLAVLFAGLGIGYVTIAQEAPKKVDSTEILNKENRNRVKKDRVAKTPEEMAKFRTERLTKALSLTEKQSADIYAIFLASAKSHGSVDKQNMTESQKEELKQLKQATMEKVNKVLTPEQQKLATELKKDKGEKMNHDRKGGKKQGKKGERSHKKGCDDKVKSVDPTK